MSYTSLFHSSTAAAAASLDSDGSQPCEVLENRYRREHIRASCDGCWSLSYHGPYIPSVSTMCLKCSRPCQTSCRYRTCADQSGPLPGLDMPSKLASSVRHQAPTCAMGVSQALR
ncbi:hypothetical protein BDW71DRAFT_33028 [Aspergillus fruticulosus]